LPRRKTNSINSRTGTENTGLKADVTQKISIPN